MKKAMLALAILSMVTLPLLADWKGRTVTVEKGAVFCDRLLISDALMLMKAGKQSALQNLADQGLCTISEQPIEATVLEDNTGFGEYPLIRIDGRGDLSWTSKDYTTAGKEALAEQKAKRQEQYAEAGRKTEQQMQVLEKQRGAAASPACTEYYERLVDLSGAGLNDTQQYQEAQQQAAECEKKQNH